MTEMKLPELGEGVLEGELIKWKVKEGDAFKPDQPLCEVMTDKATVEIPSHQTGVVEKLLVKEGSTVKPGMPILSYNDSGKGASTEQPAKSSPREATPVSAALVAKPRGAESGGTSAPSSSSGAGATSAGSQQLVTSSDAWVRSSPAVRKKAAELGVSLARVKATGPRGRVLLDDLLKNVTGKTVPQHTEGMVVRPSPSYKGELEERVPLRGLRKAIAKQMVLSKYTAPHFTYVDEVDVTKLVRLREHAKELGEKKGVKVTFLPFIVKAVIAALKEFPHLNASLDEEAQEVVVKHYFNIGIAVATKDGLIVPVVKDADHLTIFGLARAIAEKSKAALEGHSKLEDLKGGTFTITNIGGIGGLFATPIINYPEVAILGINKIQRRPVFRNGKIAVRDMTYISLSLDHRVVDGAIAAQFTNVLMRYLESPELLFLDEM